MSAERREFSLSYAGRVAVVTGAASGIGRATTERFLRCGVEVVALDLREPEPLSIAGVSSLPLAVDVRDRDSVARALTETAKTPHYLVNCAGVLDPSGFRQVSSESFLRVLDVNLVAAYSLIDIASELGELQAVVNVSSIEASRVVAISDPDPHPAYAASKAGMSMLTKTAARALAGQGTRVNAVAPGFVRTAMAAEHGDATELPAALAGRVPLRRFATADEIADSIAFLCSDQAGFITGAELVVDGGFQHT